MEVFHLMWPRTLSLGIYQVGSLLTVTLISFLTNPGRNYVIFDFAQTLAFQPVGLFGVSIAQAAFPVLSREKEKMDEFKTTFLTSFNQMLYLVLPISVLFIVLRIPLVRLIYGASPNFDWAATVLTGRTLAYLSVSIFAQALTYLVSRGFWALHDSKTPLIVGSITTVAMLILGTIGIFITPLGVIGIAVAYSIGSFLNFLFLLILLDRKIGGFHRKELIISIAKIVAATICTGVALYVPIKLLDRLVFDTTKTINLLMLTGVSSFAGLSLYLFLTWLFNVKEAADFILIFKRVGNWREILKTSNETIDAARIKQ
jgi:putative peptidoglycan lipid II flippase